MTMKPLLTYMRNHMPLTCGSIDLIINLSNIYHKSNIKVKYVILPLKETLIPNARKPHSTKQTILKI